MTTLRISVKILSVECRILIPKSVMDKHASLYCPTVNDKKNILVEQHIFVKYRSKIMEGSSGKIDRTFFWNKNALIKKISSVLEKKIVYYGKSFCFKMTSAEL